MATYKVITLAMAVKNNRIASFGETVDDSELTTNPSKLIKEGFIKEIESEESSEKSEEKKADKKAKKED